MKGTVLRSINNIYSVREDGEGKLFSCRIKGKVLDQAKGEYNPIVAGDCVEFEQSGTSEGMVLSRMDRKSSFERWNTKSQSNQTVAANMDVVVCVCSCDSPPFRPRFIDRVIACCRNVDVLICLNKCDIGLDGYDRERFDLYKKLGYKTVEVSAKTGKGTGELKKMLEGRTAAFVGQSGVGKSSLVNRLLGSNLESKQRVGEINWKYNRGNHTTNYAIVLDGPSFTIIDTPGFREISVPHDDPHLVSLAFPEFASCHCQFDSCLHAGEEGCDVYDKVEKGQIDPDRYESYLRILDSMEDRLPVWYRKGGKA